MILASQMEGRRNRSASQRSGTTNSNQYEELCIQHGAVTKPDPSDLSPRYVSKNSPNIDRNVTQSYSLSIRDRQVWYRVLSYVGVTRDVYILVKVFVVSLSPGLHTIVKRNRFNSKNL